jgi:hypothetical protein
MLYFSQFDRQHLRSQCRIVAGVLVALMFATSGAKTVPRDQERDASGIGQD